MTEYVDYPSSIQYPYLLHARQLTSKNIYSLQSEEVVHKVLRQLVIEGARNNGTPLTAEQKRKANLVRVFTDLTEFLQYSEAVSGFPYTFVEKTMLQASLVVGRGVTEYIWYAREHLWLPIIFVKAEQIGGERFFAPTLLHELQHAADMILLPEDKKAIQEKKEGIHIILLCQLIVWSALLGDVLAQNNVLLLAAFLAIITGLGYVGKYYMSDEEQRARRASHRVSRS